MAIDCNRSSTAFGRNRQLSTAIDSFRKTDRNRLHSVAID